MNDHSLKPGEVALFDETTFGAERLKFKNHLNTLVYMISPTCYLSRKRFHDAKKRSAFPEKWFRTKCFQNKALSVEKCFEFSTFVSFSADDSVQRYCQKKNNKNPTKMEGEKLCCGSWNVKEIERFNKFEDKLFWRQVRVVLWRLWTSRLPLIKNRYMENHLTRQD